MPEKFDGKHRFPSERVTIMISSIVDTKLRLALAEEIKNCATKKCDLPSTSYSRIINIVLKRAFEKKIDEKIKKSAKKEF